jgi:thymidylate synthase
MQNYLDILKYVMKNGIRKPSRTGVDRFSVTGAHFEHDMETGFPLLTTKRINLERVLAELEMFIKGITDKRWLQERNCHIWDDWCTPEKVPYGNDERTKRKMKAEPDLGPIYGWQMRHQGAKYIGSEENYDGKGDDQLSRVLQDIIEEPHATTHLIDMWGSLKDREKMARPPCHYNFQLLVNDEKLDLIWSQRSVDVMVGLPFNIASYAALQTLIARHVGREPGKLVGHLGDVHTYDFKSHQKGANIQLSRKPGKLPTILTPHFTTLFDWQYTDTMVSKYDPDPFIKLDIAI